ncbi:MAG TPA: VWA domain-containing protein [Xanthobacteraceae bacterium]|jgi:uncharacterized protein YegL|nr:VWA domain-containing protein [Xanthobacteraceae bacterium]
MTDQVLPNIAQMDVSRRKLHFIFAIDTSGSMSGDRIASLNYAVRAAIPAMKEAAADNPEVDVMVRVLRFSDTVDWPVPDAIPINDFVWNDMVAGGETNMGAAFTALAEAMSAAGMPGRQLPPVVVLMSDGLPTDESENGLAAFLASEYGAKAVRIAIAIGSDADLGLLQEFIASPTVKPLQANSAAALVNRIKWAASVPMKSVSSPVGSADPIAQIAQGVAQENAAAGDLVW